MSVSKEAIEAAVEEIRKVRQTPVWDRWTDHDAIEAVLEAALPFLSSPGKDGGQEVEAVGEAAELARLRAIALDMQAGYVEATERAEEAVKAANALQAEVDRLRATRPQPASTALVEIVKELSDYLAIHHFASDRHKAADMVARARLALSASQSTSRKGER